MTDEGSITSEPGSWEFESDLQGTNEAVAASEGRRVLNSGPYFMDIDELQVADPSNYCLLAEHRFPDS